MTNTRYVPISQADMENLLEIEMGFTRADQDTSWEMIWEREVVTKKGVHYPYKIVVFSTIDRRTGWSRDCGTDAIRLVLMDTVTGRPCAVKGTPKPRVFRTKNALVNLRQKARDMFRFVLENHTCPNCNALMVKRRGGPNNHEFYGCSHFAPGNRHHCTGTKRIPQEEKAAA